jgi:methylmalonyl-CoA mutase N-terminal domain/subunit
VTHGCGDGGEESPADAESGFEIKPVYRTDDVAEGLADRLGEPGEFLFTRWVYPTIYTHASRRCAGMRGWAPQLNPTPVSTSSATPGRPACPPPLISPR